MKARKPDLFYSSILPVLLLAICCFGTGSSEAEAAEKSGFSPILIENASVARKLKLLAAICEPEQVTMREGVPVCKTCPSYTFGGQHGLHITNTISSNFTSQSATEVLADIAGCEPATANGGGSVLLEASEQGWSRILYLPGFRSNECVRFRTLHQTASLACNISSLDQGIQRGKLELLSLRAAKPVQHKLLEWFDNSRSNPRRLISVFPHRFMKADFNSDGRVDLQVNVRVLDVTIPEEYSGFVDAVTAGHGFKEPESLRLVYLFDGSTLLLSPNSEDSKASIDALLEQTQNNEQHRMEAR